MTLLCCSLPVQSGKMPHGLSVERAVGPSTLAIADRERLVDTWNPTIRARQIAERFDAGSELWLAKLDGKLAGYGWTIQGKTIEPHFFPIQHDEVHVFDFFMFPKFRGRGLNGAFVMDILMRLSGEGIRRAHLETAAWNKSAIRHLRKTSFTPFATAIKLCVFGHPIVLWLSWGPDRAE